MDLSSIHSTIGQAFMKHIGFKGAQSSVEKEGYSKKIAGAIIAARSREASAGAKKRNPRLLKVK